MISSRGLGLRALSIALAFGGCAETVMTTEDAGPRDGGRLDALAADVATACVQSSDCDDGRFCNGRDICDADDPSADSRGCVVQIACGTNETCDEVNDRCQPAGCPDPDADADDDGARSIECGGTDCDDIDPNRFPGASEICDSADRDEDCDPMTYGFRDADGDDHVDMACCNGSGPMAVCGDDCNDMARSVFTGAPEICDGRDNDCDGATDEEGSMLYLDCDGDGFGNSRVSRFGCPEVVQPGPDCPSPGMSSTWIAVPGDCDDARTSAYPGAAELCNGMDDDCVLPIDPMLCDCTDGETTECGYDASCRRVTGTCRSGAFDCPPGLRTGAERESCDGLDQNCNDSIDEGCPCSPVGGSRPCSVDYVGACAMGTEACTPTGWAGCPRALSESCSGIDEDCDGRNDEGLHVWPLILAISGTETCDRIHAAHTCARNISNACRAASPSSGRCSSAGGYGHVEYGGDSLTAICISDLVRITDVSPSVLPGLTCDANDASFGACRAAIHRYCARMGHASGFGYPDSFSGTFTVNCISTQHG